ncbi:MAG TPA: aminoglycoside phosphotransferase family protein, partial [Actinomycetes bacterium]|nr:aminoglycoside phosphotransferase family protein [Actinomycetes bacterium]
MDTGRSAGPIGPPATGERLDWADAPAWLRGEVEARLGGRVAEAVTQPAGFSPGIAARLRLDDGRRAFVK